MLSLSPIFFFLSTELVRGWKRGEVSALLKLGLLGANISKEVESDAVVIPATSALLFLFPLSQWENLCPWGMMYLKWTYGDVKPFD